MNEEIEYFIDRFNESLEMGIIDYRFIKKLNVLIDAIIIYNNVKNPIMNTEKTLNNNSIEDVKKNVSDVEVTGDGDLFKVLCKASSKSQGWMKSTKAMEIEGVGCVVQVTTQQGNNIAEAVTFVPHVIIVDDVNGGRRLEEG